MIYVLVFIIAFVCGWVAAFIVVSKDKDLVRIADDETIVKKPAQGLVLVAAPPDILRKLVMQNDKGEMVEARDLYKKMELKNPK